MNEFVRFGIDSNFSVNIILDYGDIVCQCVIYEGSKIDLEMLKNEKW